MAISITGNMVPYRASFYYRHQVFDFHSDPFQKDIIEGCDASWKSMELELYSWILYMDWVYLCYDCFQFHVDLCTNFNFFILSINPFQFMPIPEETNHEYVETVS